MNVMFSHRQPAAAMVDEIRAERAEAGALETLIDFGRGVITTGVYVMPFARIAIPVKTLRRRVDAAIKKANTGNAGMVLEPKHYVGRAKYFAEQLDAMAVQGGATLAEAAGKPVANKDEAEQAWQEYCHDAGSTLAMFGMTELVL